MLFTTIDETKQYTDDDLQEIINQCEGCSQEEINELIAEFEQQKQTHEEQIKTEVNQVQENEA